MVDFSAPTDQGPSVDAAALVDAIPEMAPDGATADSAQP